jgi:hypothetical protein
VLAIFGCLFHDGGPRTHAQFTTVKRFLGSAEWGVIRSTGYAGRSKRRTLTHEATRFGKEGVQIFGSERHCAERSKDPLVIKQALRSGLVLSSSHA